MLDVVFASALLDALYRFWFSFVNPGCLASLFPACIWHLRLFYTIWLKNAMYYSTLDALNIGFVNFLGLKAFVKNRQNILLLLSLKT